MGHTLTWVRRAGALRTDPLDGPFLFQPKPVAGEEYYSIPVGTFLKAVPGPIDYSAPPSEPGTVEMEAGPGFHVVFTPDPPIHPYPADVSGYREQGLARWLDGPDGEPTGEAEFVVRPRKNGKATEAREKHLQKQEEVEATRQRLLKRARGGPDQRMKDWKKKANALLKGSGLSEVTQEESQRESKRRRNIKAHDRKKDRDVDAERSKIGITAERGSQSDIGQYAGPGGIQIVGGPRMDVLTDGKMGPLTIVANEHLQRAVQSSMRGSLLN